MARDNTSSQSQNHHSARCRDLNQRQFQKQALFEQSLCLLCLKAESSCIKPADSDYQQCEKNCLVVLLWKKCKIPSKPESCEDNHLKMIHFCPVIWARIFLYLFIEGDGFVIDVCVSQWSFGYRILVSCDCCQKLEIVKFLQIFHKPHSHALNTITNLMVYPLWK